MEARPLETIPEETKANRVTSDVPKTKPVTAKNPGCVAPGKRLAEAADWLLKQKNKLKHKNPLQTRPIQIKPQTNPAAQSRQITPQPTCTLFWGLVV